MPSSLTITPIPAFEDNYIWCIEDVKSDTFIVVDPGDAHVVIEHAIKIERKLSAIFQFAKAMPLLLEGIARYGRNKSGRSDNSKRKRTEG